jgi:hypothetical protein
MSEFFGHTSVLSLAELLQGFAQRREQYNWLVVALDSIRGRQLRERDLAILDLFTKAGVHAWWRDEGFWLDGRTLNVINHRLIPPFSAAFAFRQDHAAATPPLYDATSESNIFSQGLPMELPEAVRSSGALGYFADGCGLNYYSIDDQLSDVLQNIISRV